jgi:translation initiation factor 3 subunit L
MTLTPTWAYDLVQEFVYQFQEFCQYRCQINVNRSEEDIRTLTSHREVWSYPAVVQLLTGLIRASHITEFLVATPARETTHDAIMGSVQLLLGYFAIIELARLECLVGDHTASLQAVAPLRLLDKSEFFINVPSSYVNTLYHAGVCFIMSRRYADAMDTLGHLIVYVSNALKPGAASHMRISAPSQLQKIMDKAIALAGVSANLCPGHRLDDQVKELVASKLGDRLRRLQLGETNVYVEMFEGSCPKFVSPAIPTYRTPEKVNRCYEAVQLRVRAFAAEAAQESLLIKLRSYLRLYSAIDVEKLAGFVGLSRDDLLSLLISFKHKSHQVQSIANGRSTTASSEETLVSCDIGIHVRGSSVVVESTSGGSSSRDILLAEHFVSGIKKHAQINARVNRILP